MSVRGFRLMPGARLESGPLVVHPVAMLGTSYDTNPDLTGDGHSGASLLRTHAGLQAAARGADGSSLSGDATIDHVRYIDGMDARSTGFGAGANGTLALPKADLSLDGAWRRSDEPEADAPELAMRDRTTAGIGLGGEGRTLTWGLSLRHDSLDYRDDTPTFSRNVRDHIRTSASGRLGLMGGQASLLGLDATASQTARDQSSAASDDTSFALQARWRHAMATRSSLDLRLGGVIRRHQEPTAGWAGNDDQDLLLPTASAELVWWWEFDTHIMANISTGPGESIAGGANACQSVQAILGLRVGLRDRLMLAVDGLLAHRQDTGAVPGAEPMSQRDMWMSAGLEYRFRDGLGIRPRIELQRSQASDQSAFDRALFAIEVAVAL